MSSSSSTWSTRGRTSGLCRRSIVVTGTLNGDALKGAQADKNPPLSVEAALFSLSAAWVGPGENGDTTVELVFAWVYDDAPNGGTL